MFRIAAAAAEPTDEGSGESSEEETGRARGFAAADFCFFFTAEGVTCLEVAAPGLRARFLPDGWLATCS